jgi:hypothetical protein
MPNHANKKDKKNKKDYVVYDFRLRRLLGFRPLSMPLFDMNGLTGVRGGSIEIDELFEEAFLLAVLMISLYRTGERGDSASSTEYSDSGVCTAAGVASGGRFIVDKGRGGNNVMSSLDMTAAVDDRRNGLLRFLTRLNVL